MSATKGRPPRSPKPTLDPASDLERHPEFLRLKAENELLAARVEWLKRDLRKVRGRLRRVLDAARQVAGEEDGV